MGWGGPHSSYHPNLSQIVWRAWLDTHCFTSASWALTTSYKLAPFSTSGLLNVYSKFLCSCLFSIFYCCSCLPSSWLILIILFWLFFCPVECFFPSHSLWARISSSCFLILFSLLSLLIFLYTQFSLVVSSTSVVKKTNALCGLVTAFFFGTKKCRNNLIITKVKE